MLQVNPWIYPAFAVGAAVGVFIDARRRRGREAEQDHGTPAGGGGAGSDDWDYVSPDPFRWAFLVLAFTPLALPAYFLRGKKWGVAGGALAVGLAACVATFYVAPSLELRNPFHPNEKVPWSRFPPGLSAEVRKATEALPSQLATQVIDVLPGLIKVGRSYPGGAEISVKPGESEARVLIEIHSDEFIIMAALRLFEVRDLAQKVLERDTLKKKARSIDLAAGRKGTILGPVPQPDAGEESAHYIELYERRGDMLTHIFAQEKKAEGSTFSKGRRAALEGEVFQLSTKLVQQIVIPSN